MVTERSRTGMVVNAGVANIYRDAAFSSEIVTQAILGEAVKVIDQQGKWFQIEQWDGYKGWLYHFYLVRNPRYLKAVEVETISRPVITIHSEADSGSPVIRDAVFGCRLAVVERREPWARVSLPDGAEGWLQNPLIILQGGSRQLLVNIARSFQGVQYFWGGKTAKGFDCSGFVQTCFKALNIELPRDARLQRNFSRLAEVTIKDSQPGDLLFFAEDQKITHVALALGDERILHASGWVREESLAKGDPDYNHQLRKLFNVGKNISALIDD